MAHAPRYGPFVLAPPLTSCEPAYLVFGQGTPPYSIAVAGTQDVNLTALETLPLQSTPGVLRWRTDFNAGANLTFVLTDGAGQHAYSAFRVVQPGAVSTCPRGQPKKPNRAGAIAGGVVAAVAAVGLIALASLWYVRRARRRAAMQLAAERDAQFAASLRATASNGGAGGLVVGKDPDPDNNDDDDDRPLTEDAAGVVRAGTFNLGAVRFTEDSLDHLRAIDRPPAYDVPPPPLPPPPPVSGSSDLPARATASSRSGHATAVPAPPPSRGRDNDDEIRELPSPPAPPPRQ
ncbi:hypothetical protein JCM3774_004573 [Rhodotorula dairenensis]